MISFAFDHGKQNVPNKQNLTWYAGITLSESVKDSIWDILMCPHTVVNVMADGDELTLLLHHFRNLPHSIDTRAEMWFGDIAKTILYWVRCQ